MDRRAYLTALTPFIAGCFGANRGQPRISSGGQQTSSTAKPAKTVSEDSASTPGESSEPQTDTESETDANEAIEAAQDTFKEAVYLYVGGASHDLLSVSAATDSFQPREVLLKLDEVQRAVHEADTTAATDEQRQTVESLDTAQTFLTHATDAQSWLIDGHETVLSVYSALKDESLDTAGDELDALEKVLGQIDAPLSTIGEETDKASMDATSAIDAEEYTAKTKQFSAEFDAMDSLYTMGEDVLNGVELVQEARDEADSGRRDDAADTADRAYDLLSEVEGKLSDFSDELSDRAEAFEDVTDDLTDLAAKYAAEADDIADRNA